MREKNQTTCSLLVCAGVCSSKERIRREKERKQRWSTTNMHIDAMNEHRTFLSFSLLSFLSAMLLFVEDSLCRWHDVVVHFYYLFLFLLVLLV